MTIELFREDATLLQCEARITALDAAGVALDRTVFYPQGGGQAGDAGVLRLADGRDARHRRHAQGAARGRHAGRHRACAGGRPGERAAGAAAGRCRRRRGRRAAPPAAHALSLRDALLCALVPHPVDGCSITADYARLDFHMTEPLDKVALNEGLARLVGEAHAVRHRWISDAELDAQPQLVRSMSVQPPRGSGRVRLLEIEGVDLQPCGGTHVANTRDIGAVVVTKIEKKSAHTRRVVLGLADPA